MGRASNGKRAAARAAAPVEAPTVVVPRSVERLGPSAVRLCQTLQGLELERRKAAAELDQLVATARSRGVSWAAIGWAVGISGEGARQKWGQK